MTVCQFFLQGRCRFGKNCRFEHTYNNDDRNNRNPINSQQLSNVVKQIVEEVILAEKGGQWPLSCFSPVKGGPNIPGWEDFSPEEVRWKMYEARVNGTLNQCNLDINQLYSNAEKMRNLIKEPTMERVTLIVNLLKGRKEPSSPSNQFSSSSSSTNIFGSSSQPTVSQNNFGNTASNIGGHGSIFGGSSSSFGNIFGGSNQTTGNIFGGSTSFSNQSIFGGSNSSNTFSQNSFSNPQTSGQSIFSHSSSSGSGNIYSSASISSQNLFSKTREGNDQNVSNAFLPSKNSGGVLPNQLSGRSIFGPNATFFQNTENQHQNVSNIFRATQNGSIFSTPNTFNKTSSNMFNSQQELNKHIFNDAVQQNSFTNNQLTHKEFDSSVYSKMEDLNKEEIKSYASATFVFGKIPVKPPPKEYCK